jgi:hypothetical protein
VFSAIWRLVVKFFAGVHFLLVSGKKTRQEAGSVYSRLIQGRWLGAQDFEVLQQLIAEHPHWSRRRLSIALCEALN